MPFARHRRGRRRGHAACQADEGPLPALLVHPAAAAPLITRQALFEQAGIIATTSFGELLDAAELMSSQPVPAGSAVAIVSNGGGAGALAAHACADVGLAVAATGRARGRLRQVLPAAASVDGPVDTTAAVSPQAFAEALCITAAEEGVAAPIAMVVRIRVTSEHLADPFLRHLPR